MRVNFEPLNKSEIATWKPGQRLLLPGKLLTGRDAAHKRIQDMLGKGEKLPVDFTNRVIYYVAPVDPVRDPPGDARVRGGRRAVRARLGAHRGG